ncbi:unnamed protein product [Sphagnum tenellum]
MGGFCNSGSVGKRTADHHHHHHHHHHNNNNNNNYNSNQASGQNWALAAAGVREEAAAVAQGMNVVQSLQQQQHNHPNTHGVPSVDNHLHLHAAAGTVTTGPTITTTTGSSACQECGNQAKKDCSYQRCRTCCKSRGFECSTHLKSTWVPAAKRRERQAAEASATSSGALLLHRPGKSKHARTTTIATALVANATNSLTTTSAISLQGGGASDLNNSAHLTATHPSQTMSSSKGGLPPEVRAQALFKCVRLMGVEDSENEFAYQATVKIGGHIFKGVLYDQGVDNGQAAAAAPSPSALGELQLGGGNSRGGGMPSSSSALIDPSSSLYGSGSALLGGQTSFTHKNNLQHSY